MRQLCRTRPPLNIPDADGLVADLGGGSIEIVFRKGCDKAWHQLNFALIRCNESEITKALLSADWIAERQAKRLLELAAVFAPLAAFFWAAYPLPVLHGAKIKADFVHGLWTILQSKAKF